jgi:hypothetical protein
MQSVSEMANHEDDRCFLCGHTYSNHGSLGCVGVLVWPLEVDGDGIPRACPSSICRCKGFVLLESIYPERYSADELYEHLRATDP